MEFILAVAALCQVFGGNAHPIEASDEQRKCHKYYMTCYLKSEHRHKTPDEFILLHCAKDRK
jgi:hypothetical protein